VKKAFVSDCEGPISINDNALENARHFIPNGERIFTAISRYDDVVADVIKRPRYRAGDTVKLILPFLKAYDATDDAIRRLAEEKLLLVPGAEEMLRNVGTFASEFIVSTSYEHYIQALCKTVGFPFENTYCTRFSLDRYVITEQEKEVLKRIARQIASISKLETSGTVTNRNITEKDKEIVRRFDEIFWGRISEMNVGRIYSEVKSVGGKEKEKAIIDIIKKMNLMLCDVMYVGDSITDVEAFKLVKENGGLAVSFNGNQYAVKNAEIAVLSSDATVTAVIADVFARSGRRETLRFVDDWQGSSLKKSKVGTQLLDRLFKAYPKGLPKVKVVTDMNREALAEESSRFRKLVRGKAIGSLG
jgi:energy-converting hydrogenase A subunit R